MQTAVPLACFLSLIRPPGVQYENALLQIAPVDKSKCPFIKNNNDVGFQLFTRHNPTVFQELIVGDDEKLFASNMDFTDKTVIYFHAWMEQPDDGSGIMVREAYMQRGDTNVIMVDAHHLEAGPWYFTAAQNTWYIGRFAAQFIDYLASRGLNLNNTHIIGHSLGAHAAGVAGSALKSGRVSRITGLDPALPLFDNLPLEQRLDTTDAHFVDIIHTDAGIFGYKGPMGHVDFYPNGGISPQPGCELEVVIPQQLLLNKCDAQTQTRGFYSYYLTANQDSTLKSKSLELKLQKLFAYIQSVKEKLDKHQNISEKVKSDHFDEEKSRGIKYNVNKTDQFYTDEIKGFQPELKRTIITEDLFKDLVAKDDSRQHNNSQMLKEEFNPQNDSADYTEELLEDQIAEASKYDVTRVKYNQDTLKEKETLSVVGDSEEVILANGRTKREATNDNITINKTETQKPILLNDNDSIKITERRDTTRFSLLGTGNTKISNINIDSTVTTSTMKVDEKGNEEFYYKKPCVTKKKTDYNIRVNTSKTTVGYPLIEDIKYPKVQPNGINILNVLENTYRISRIISAIKDIKNNKFESKSTMFNRFFGTDKSIFSFFKSDTTTPKTDFKNLIKRPETNRFSFLKPKIADTASNERLDKNRFSFFKIDSTAPKDHVIKRQKRFLPFFKQSDDNNGLLFRMLNFLIKNRKNVLPVFTVMREINTLVKSGNGELNHYNRESNNYIGATPPVLSPLTYSLELGAENKVVSFVKRLLGVSPKGDRLTISESGK